MKKILKRRIGWEISDHDYSVEYHHIYVNQLRTKHHWYERHVTWIFLLLFLIIYFSSFRFTPPSYIMPIMISWRSWNENTPGFMKWSGHFFIFYFLLKFEWNLCRVVSMRFGWAPKKYGFTALGIVLYICVHNACTKRSKRIDVKVPHWPQSDPDTHSTASQLLLFWSTSL